MAARAATVGHIPAHDASERRFTEAVPQRPSVSSAQPLASKPTPPSRRNRIRGRRAIAAAGMCRVGQADGVRDRLHHPVDIGPAGVVAWQAERRLHAPTPIKPPARDDAADLRHPSGCADRRRRRADQCARRRTAFVGEHRAGSRRWCADEACARSTIMPRAEQPGAAPASRSAEMPPPARPCAEPATALSQIMRQAEHAYAGIGQFVHRLDVGSDRLRALHRKQRANAARAGGSASRRPRRRARAAGPDRQPGSAAMLAQLRRLMQRARLVRSPGCDRPSFGGGKQRHQVGLRAAAPEAGAAAACW